MGLSLLLNCALKIFSLPLSVNKDDDLIIMSDGDEITNPEIIEHTSEWIYSDKNFTIEQTCPECAGSGEQISNPCKECRGLGKKQTKTSTLSPDAKIPVNMILQKVCQQVNNIIEASKFFL